MPKSFIKFKPITGHSEEHNNRKISPKYLVKPSAENVYSSNCSIAEKRAELEKIVKEKTGRKMQKKATPIKEAVILLPDDNFEKNSNALRTLVSELYERYDIKAFQGYIHNDEGHTDENGNTKYNYHAHLVVDWIDHNTGKSLRLTKEDMSDIQTLTAEILSMERGEKGSKSLSLTHQEYRGFMKIRDSMQKKLERKINAEEEQELRQELIKKREEEKREKRHTRWRELAEKYKIRLSDSDISCLEKDTAFQLIFDTQIEHKGAIFGEIGISRDENYKLSVTFHKKIRELPKQYQNKSRKMRL